MKRIALLALTASLVVSCDQPTNVIAPPPAVLSLSSTQTSYSGQATVVQARVLNAPSIILGNAGPLPESGGSAESSLLNASVPPDQTGGHLGLTVVVGHATTVGQGRSSRSEASLAVLTATVASNSIEAAFLRSEAQATCDDAGTASASGSSEIAGLVINGQAITVSGEPNQRVELAGVTVVINEQTQSASGNRADITVNALHVTAVGPLGQLVELVVASAHADIACAACNDQGDDFVTGGGWITGTPSGAKANFGVAGGIKNGRFWGHLNYIDHGDGLKVKGTGVTGYEVVPGHPTARRITGTAEVNGAGGFTYTLEVADNGEPGRDDDFSISLSNGYAASGKLAGGNVQLHMRPIPCP